MSIMPAGGADVNGRGYRPASSMRTGCPSPGQNLRLATRGKPGDGPPHLVNPLDGDTYLQVGM
jgi:hypothetical protein